MPLRAYIDHEEIISIDQTDKQWDDLKKRLKNKESLLRLPCCMQEGFPRTSSKGFKHFVHSKSDNTCDGKPESPEHLKAKIEIIEACKENGWQAIPEFSEADWRADVLAIQKEKIIAFEVQWSKQTLEETKFRQKRYKKSNVRGCWFFRTVPKELRHYDDTILADKELPVFKILKDEEANIVVQFRETQLPLKNFVDSLLNRKLKFCEHIQLKSVQEVSILFFETTCWKCGTFQHCYTVEDNLLTMCDQDFRVADSLWGNDGLDKNLKIYEAVKNFLKSDKGKNLNVGQLKNRYSKTINKKYLSHGCFHCDIIFGDYQLISEKMQAYYDSDNIICKVEVDLGIMKAWNQHWCFSENGKFCE